MWFTPVANADSKSMALAASGKGVHHITTVPAFKGILNEWDSLVALLKSEMMIHGNKAPETNRIISELRKN